MNPVIIRNAADEALFYADNLLTDMIHDDDVKMLMAQPNWAARITRNFNSTQCDNIIYMIIQGGMNKCLDAILTHCGRLRLEGQQSKHLVNGRTPFMFAVMTGSVRILQVLLRHADARRIALHVHTTSSPHEKSPTNVGAVAMAVLNNRRDSLKCLLNDGRFDVNERGVFRGNKCDNVPLRIAMFPFPIRLFTARERRAFVEVLVIDHHAVINFTDDDGNTPLHAAVKYNDVELVELFLTDDVNLLAKNNRGQTALQMSKGAVKKAIQAFFLERKRKNTKCTKVQNENSDVDIKNQTFQESFRLSASNELAISEKENDKITVTPTLDLDSETTSSTASQTTLFPKIRSRSTNSKLCMMCKSIENGVTTVLLPCNHLALCQQCGVNARKNKRFNCPMCKQRVTKYVQVQVDIADDCSSDSESDWIMEESESEFDYTDYDSDHDDQKFLLACPAGKYK